MTLDSFIPQPPSGSTYSLRCFLAGELLTKQFPSALEELDDAILLSIQGNSINAKILINHLEYKGHRVSKRDINSRLYTMLSKGLVKRYPSSLRSKAPLWSLS